MAYTLTWSQTESLITAPTGILGTQYEDGVVGSCTVYEAVLTDDDGNQIGHGSFTDQDADPETEEPYRAIEDRLLANIDRDQVDIVTPW